MSIAGHYINLLVKRGQEDNINIALFSYFPAEIKSAALTQVDVTDNQVDFIFSNRSSAPEAVNADRTRKPSFSRRMEIPRFRFLSSSRSNMVFSREFSFSFDSLIIVYFLPDCQMKGSSPENSMFTLFYDRYPDLVQGVLRVLV